MGSYGRNIKFRQSRIGVKLDAYIVDIALIYFNYDRFNPSNFLTL